MNRMQGWKNGEGVLGSCVWGRWVSAPAPWTAGRRYTAKQQPADMAERLWYVASDEACMAGRANGAAPAELQAFQLTWIVVTGLQHVSQVPQLDSLVLAVADQVVAVALRVHVRHAIRVAHKQASWLRVAA